MAAAHAAAITLDWAQKTWTLMVCVVVGCLAAPTAHAHDFWIQPAAFEPTPGTPLDVRLIIGHDEVRNEYKRNPRHMLHFVCFRPSGKQVRVPGEWGDIGGRIAVNEPGFHLFAYRSSFSYHSLPPARFSKYLKTEDLLEARAQHATHMWQGLPQSRVHARTAARIAACATPLVGVGIAADAACEASQTKVREGFARCAKSLVMGGKPNQDATTGQFDRVVGLPYEITIESNPATTPLGTPLTFRVLHAGKPAAGARLAAYRERHPEHVVEVRTDAEGRGVLLLDQPGMWIARSIRIRHVQTATVDWLSLWATLTLER